MVKILLATKHVLHAAYIHICTGNTHAIMHKRCEDSVGSKIYYARGSKIFLAELHLMFLMRHDTYGYDHDS